MHGRWSSTMLHQVTVTTTSLLAVNSTIMALYSDHMSLSSLWRWREQGTDVGGAGLGRVIKKEKGFFRMLRTFLSNTHRQKAESSVTTIIVLVGVKQLC